MKPVLSFQVVPLAKWLLVAGCLGWTCSGGAAESVQTWTNAAGKSMVAAFIDLQQDQVKVKLAGGKLYMMPLEDLTWESAQQAIRLNWKPGGRVGNLRLETPDKVGLSNVEVKRVEPKEAGASPIPPGWIRYHTPRFEFDIELELTPAFLKRAGLAFESTRLLLHELPWRIEAKPLKGDLFVAKIYKNDESYFKAGGPTGSAGVFQPSTGEFSLPWQGEGGNLDTIQHEITHQMMQRILPVMPWWIAEGTAEYVSIMKYQNGYFACNVISRRQVIPELQKRAELLKGPRGLTIEAGLKDPFAAAMEYRGETDAEASMEQYLVEGERQLKRIRDQFNLQITHVKEQLAPLEEKRDMFAKMLSQEAGQCCIVNLPPAKQPPQVAAKRINPGEIKDSISQFVPANKGLAMAQRYAASTLLVYHMTTFSRDKGEGFARYMWGLQELRDEYDFSLNLLKKDLIKFSKEVDALNPQFKEMVGQAQAHAETIIKYLRNAEFYANEQGRFSKTPTGQTEFTHLPGGSLKLPLPPPVLDLKIPPLPSAPLARLTSQQLKARRDELFNQLTNGMTAKELVAEAREAFGKRGITF